MATSPTSSGDHFPSIAVADDADHTLQPFFVLHKAQPSVIEEKSPSRSGRGKRKASSPEKVKYIAPSEEPLSDAFLEQLRRHAFDKTWSKIQSTIQGVLRDINLKLFDQVVEWVEESFGAIKSNLKLTSSDIQKPYPLVTDALCTKIPTAFVLTKNAEYVDDIQTFKDLGLHLKSDGCHVANISALDFSAKSGLGGSLKSLLRQLTSQPFDVADMMILARWYCEEQNLNKPIIIMIDDLERCNGSILADFITMLSEWVMKIPIFFIMGVATTIEAPKKILSSDSLQYLNPCKFTSGCPSHKMDSLIESVLVRFNAYFTINHHVAVFLRNYFLKHDGTVTSFITALKLACCKHFSLEPLSFLSLSILEKDSEEYWHEKFDSLPESMKQHAFDLPSCKSAKFLQNNGSNIFQGLSDLRDLQKNWSSVTLCLFEVARHGKIQLLDILCEALEPEMNNNYYHNNSSENGFKHIREMSGHVIGSIAQAIHLLREMPATSLSNVLAKWDIHTKGMTQINEEVKELQSLLSSAGEGQENLPTIRSRRAVLLGAAAAAKGTPLNDKVALLLDTMLRKYMIPPECIPFHEIICFTDVHLLQSALIGDPRRRIQVDLLKSQSYITCSCCTTYALSSSMHDSSIMYNLAQEYGDVINVHDWYQAFKSIMTNHTSNTPKKKSRLSSPSKKPKSTPISDTDALIQGRFCRAVMELQITGLLGMPSKRRPDFVQRIAFGI